MYIIPQSLLLLVAIITVGFSSFSQTTEPSRLTVSRDLIAIHVYSPGTHHDHFYYHLAHVDIRCTCTSNVFVTSNRTLLVGANLSN